MDEEWVDGPVVRPYWVTGGRTADDRDDLDLVAVVRATGVGPPAKLLMGPEHEDILAFCATAPSVVEVASQFDLALGVVRVLLGDLLDHGLIVAHMPAPVARFPNERILKEVIDGLHAL
jgi:hypothetical protein